MPLRSSLPQDDRAGQCGRCYNPFLSFRRAFFIGVVALAAAFFADAQKGKKKTEEPITQTLPVLKDPPPVAKAETGHLIFQVSPLTNKGLLSAQVREALKTLMHEAHGAEIVKLRAFVAGTGDMRRVQTIVSEVFTEKKLNLPAVSTIEVGGLPMEGAQVAMESVAAEKRVVNPNGLALFSGQQAKSVNPALAQLQTAVREAGVDPKAVLRVTCFLSTLDDLPAAKSGIATVFPGAAADIVQLQRLGVEPLAECEAVGRLRGAPASPVVFLNPASLAANPNYTQIVLVNTPKLAFTGTQMAFRDQESDVKLAFERLGKVLDSVGVTYKEVVWSSVYPLTRTIADKVRAVRGQFYDHTHPPASTFLLFEGLPSLDATVAVEVVAGGR